MSKYDFVTTDADGNTMIIIPLANAPGESYPKMPNDILQYISQLWEQAKEMAARGDFGPTVPVLMALLKALPNPRSQWESATMVYAGLGDSFYRLKLYGPAEGAMRQALLCPGGVSNPLVWAVLGQALLDMGREDEALDPLMSAYMLEGEEIFGGEDSKYLQFLRSRVNLDEPRR